MPLPFTSKIKMAFDPRNFPKNTPQYFCTKFTNDPGAEAGATEAVFQNKQRLTLRKTIPNHINDPQRTCTTNRHPLNEQYDLLLKYAQEKEKSLEKRVFVLMINNKLLSYAEAKDQANTEIEAELSTASTNGYETTLPASQSSRIPPSIYTVAWQRY
jgi:hypothetical protein